MVKLIAVSLWQNNHQLTCQAADFDKNFFNERQLSQDRRYQRGDDDHRDQDDRDGRWGDDQSEDEDEDQSDYNSKSHESGRTNKISMIIMRN